AVRGTPSANPGSPTRPVGRAWHSQRQEGVTDLAGLALVALPAPGSAHRPRRSAVCGTPSATQASPTPPRGRSWHSHRQSPLTDPAGRPYVALPAPHRAHRPGRSAVRGTPSANPRSPTPPVGRAWHSQRQKGLTDLAGRPHVALPARPSRL